jgi:hypothetical protein
VSGILSVTGNANVGNIGAGAAVLAGPLSGVTTINASGNANVGNIGATNSVVSANATFGNINSVSGILSVTGNANVGNIGAGAAVLAGPLSGVTTINASGNANVGNIGATRGVFTSIVGNLETTAQSNITVVGTLTGLTVSGNLNAQANVFVTSNITAGNINSVSGILSVTGNANVGNIGAGAAVLAGPLSGVTTINASGNANVGNLGAAAGVFTSNVSAGNISTTGVLSVTGNANVGNLGVAGLITATGNITGANITSNGNISTSNLAVTNLSNLGNVGNVRITGGSTDYVLRTDGAGNLSWVAAGLISGNVNVGTSTRLAYYATSGQSISDTGANLTWNGSNLLTVTGNISAGNVSGTLTTAAQPNVTSVGSLSSLTVTGNLSAGNISTTGVLSVTGNANVGNLGATNIVGTLATNAQPNVTSVGNLVALNAGLTNITASTDSTSTTSGALVVAGGVGIGGNLNVGAANRAHVITGNVTITGNITVTGNQNIIGSNNISYTDNILELHNQANSAPWTTDDGKDVGIRVHYYKGADKHAFFGWSNDAQSLEYYYDGTESGGVFSGSYGTFKGNVFHSTATTGTAPFTINSTTQVANLHAALAGSVTGNAQANITSVGTLTSLSVTGNANVGNLGAAAGVFTGAITGSTTLNVTGNANVGNLGAAAGVFTGAITGSTTLNVTGNANVGNLGAAAGVFTGAITGSTTLNVTGNANVGNIGATRGVFTNISGTIESGSASQTNITAVGTLSSLTVSGNITGQSNVLVTSNITAGNINSVSGILSVTGNANVGNIGSNNAVFTGTLSVTGNSTQGNITTGNTITYGQFGTPIKLRVLSDNSLSFDGASGQLFSITDTLTGDIFSVNDITGLPSIRVDSNATVYLAEISGNVGIGNVAPAHKLSVTGTMNVSGNANVGNLGATAGVFSGNITAGNINSVSGILSVTGNANVGNIGATRGVFTNIAGTLETASQTNITAVGTLSSLTVSGNAFLATSSGNVGIGTVTPNSPLHVVGSQRIQNSAGSAFLDLYTSSTLRGQIYIDATTNGLIFNSQTNPILFYANGERARFAVTTGNFLLGTTTDDTTNKLQVAGGVNFGGASGLTWDNTNSRLGVGTSTPTAGYRQSVVQPDNGFYTGLYVLSNNLTQALSVGWGGISGTLGIQIRTASAAAAINFIQNATTVGSFAATSGNFIVGTTTDSGYKLDVAKSGSSGTAIFYDQTLTTGVTKVVVQAGANQTTTNLTEWQNNAGTNLAIVDSAGKYRSDWFTDLADVQMALRASGMQINSAYNFAWSSGGSYANAKDLGFRRSSAGVLEINNGTAGTYRDLIARTITVHNGTASKAILDAATLLVRVANDSMYGFSSTAGATGTIDLALYRNSAGLLEINNGTAGTYRDLILRGLTATNTAGTAKLVWDSASERLGVVSINDPTTNNALNLGLWPNGTATQSILTLYNNSAGGSAQYAQITIVGPGTGSEMRILTGANTGAAGDIVMSPGGTERMRWFRASGSVAVGTATDSGYKLEVANSGSSGTARFYDATALSGSTKVVVRAGAGQSGNLQEWQSSAGTVGVWIPAAGSSLQANSGLVAGGGSGAFSAGYYSAGLDMSSAWYVGWSSTTAANGGLDLSIARNAAGVLEINNGTAGTYRDLILRNITSSGNISGGNLIAGNLVLGSDALTSSNSTITIDPSTVGTGGNVIIQGNLQVTGTTTTINSTTMDVTDLNITVAKGAANPAAANGAGLTIDGAAATLTYNSTSNIWVFDRALSVSGNANVSNIGATNSVITANGTFGNINSVSGILSVTGNANVGNIGATRGVFTNISGTIESGSASQTNITAVGTLTALTVSGNITGQSNVLVTSNITAGNINSVSGILSVTGNANVGNVGATRGVFTNISGTIESGSASQTNITAVGTLGSLTVSGNAFLSTSSGNVGVGTSTPAYKLEVNGSFAATTKSFVIDHPTQTGMKLRYGSLEGPENGVYVRGRSSSHVIDLPEYWSKLVDPASITVNITPIGQSQNIVVMAYDNQQVTLAGVEAEYFYTVNAERIDVEKLTVEFEA